MDGVCERERKMGHKLVELRQSYDWGEKLYIYCMYIHST